MFFVYIYNIYLAASASVGYVSVSKNISKAWCCLTSTESSARFLLVVFISGKMFYTNPEAVFSHFCVEHHFTMFLKKKTISFLFEGHLCVLHVNKSSRETIHSSGRLEDMKTNFTNQQKILN